MSMKISNRKQLQNIVSVERLVDAHQFVNCRSEAVLQNLWRRYDPPHGQFEVWQNTNYDATSTHARSNAPRARIRKHK